MIRTIRRRLAVDPRPTESMGKCVSVFLPDVSSHSEVVHRALCPHRNGATVITSTETIVGPDLRMTEGLNHA
jgi:hypothetical protein